MTTSEVSASAVENKATSSSKLVILIQLIFVIATNFLPWSYDIVPAMILIILILRYEDKPLSFLGFRAQNSWIKLFLLAFVAAFITQILAVVLNVVIFLVGLELPNTSQFDEITGNITLFLKYLLITWTIAAFGEEIVWRGFFMTKVVSLFDNSRLGWSIALISSSTIFGLLHLYQGLAGALITGFVGLIFGILYIRSKQNLWLCILTHGIVDTIGFVLLFAGAI